ncbi:hypothetical protein M3I53_01210 [Paraburkholderia sp. CNPSo 3272]|uniref:hypothetical protein n=1 Tax=Paraburkholderia sp. CNPSo 3272 TaxID=2940931 RepID=UPI0020B86723|nr:hypothetical protein [Paraburkholderia sp. CNPSo 3272]MCP3721755.1 hypothetical protein [Paraburkholderia sp. CNPSo 3272]
MHLPHHQEMLRNAAKHGGIDAVMHIIREENSAALHIETGERETLSQRVFLNQPARNLPMKGFVNHVDWAMVAEATRIAHLHSSGTRAASSNNEATNAASALA